MSAIRWVICLSLLLLFFGNIGVSGAQPPQACPSGQNFCIDKCVDLNSDINNCGGCGKICGINEVCQEGQCKSCDDKNVCTMDKVINGNCVHDPISCDDGNPCTDDSCNQTTGCIRENNTAPCNDVDACTQVDICQNGVCTGTYPVVCTAQDKCHDAGYCDRETGVCSDAINPQAGYALCNGACISVLADNNNCGACGNVCTGGQTCINGACAPVGCDPGTTACGGNCVDTSSDNNNCGVCGHSCAAPETCISGTCTQIQCQEGTADCDGAPGNGCETHIQTSSSNCGACGNVCTGGQTCINGACAPVGCDPGTTACGSNCVDTSSDNNNCGVCGHSCTAPETCVSGTCTQVQCPEGTADCDGVPINGCETHIRTNINNCGACGNVCTGGQTCINGACAPAS